MTKFIIPGLRLQHLLILSTCFYLMQAIATADGRFALNHSLAVQIKERGWEGIKQSLGWMNTSADAIDKWSAKQFGKDPWASQSDFLSSQTHDCVTTPSYGRGYLSPEKISRYHHAKQKNLTVLGSPLCKSVSGNLRYLTSDPNQLFEVNSKDLNDYGTVQSDDRERSLAR